MLGPKNKILDENFLKLVIDLITNYLFFFYLYEIKKEIIFMTHISINKLKNFCGLADIDYSPSESKDSLKKKVSKYLKNSFIQITLAGKH